MKKNLLKRDGVQSLIASLLCVVLGLLIGYIVLLIINPAGAGEAITTVIKNFLTYKKPETQMKYFGNTLVRTAPLLMCSLSILFAYKAGLFNIGAAGQYCAGAGMALYAALAWHMPWWLCMIMAMLGGALLGDLSLSLGRGDDAPHLGEGVHIKGHIIHFALVICNRRIYKVIKFNQACHIIPNPLV